MRSLTFTRPNRLFVPGRGAKIDRRHPLATGLIGAYLPGVMRGHPVGAVGPQMSDGSGGAGTLNITAEGPSFKSATSGSPRGLTVASPSEFTSWTGMTLFWRGVVNGNPDAFCDFISVSYTDSDSPPYLVLSVSNDGSGGDLIKSFFNSGGSGGSCPGFGVDISGQHGTVISLAVTALVGGNVTLYINGTSQGTSALSSSPTSANSKFNINQGIDAVNRSPNADCNVAYAWNRELSAAEIMQLQNDAYPFFVDPIDEFFASPQAVAAAGDTLFVGGGIHFI